MNLAQNEQLKIQTKERSLVTQSAQLLAVRLKSTLEPILLSFSLLEDFSNIIGRVLILILGQGEDSRG